MTDETLAKRETDITDSAYKAGLGLLNDSYKTGKIFSKTPKPDDSLSEIELLSVLALAPSMRKEIIEKYLHKGGIFSISTTGVLAWAVANVLDEYSDAEKINFEKYFTKCEEYFDKKIDVDGLFSSSEPRNWLNVEGRSGVLVENQAYYAKILDVLSLLTNDDIYDFKKKRLVRSVRDRLDGAYVLDKEDSFEVRSNSLVAAFFAPELFGASEWEKTFDAALGDGGIWLSWGGLTTLGQTDPHYTSERDGESWFFVNNMAAIVLQRLNSDKYAGYIEKILGSSTENITWQEHTGRPCEVTLMTDRNLKVQGLYGLSLATYIYLYRLTKNS